MTPELAAEGVAREVIRAIQDLRKSTGLAVEDRIELWLASDDDEVAAALARHGDMIASEVLAVSAATGDAPRGVAIEDVPLESGSARVGLRKVADA